MSHIPAATVPCWLIAMFAWCATTSAATGPSKLPELEIGNMVEVRSPTELKTGSSVVATLAKGIRLKVYDVRGDWILSHATVRGERTSGWVRRQAVSRIADPAREAAARIKPLHATKQTAQSSDWLATHPESGQSLDEYIASQPQRPDRRQQTIYVQPLGAFTDAEEKLVARAVELLGIVYGVPVTQLRPLGLDVIPSHAQRTNDQSGARQLLSPYILNNVLKPRQPADALAVIALTTTDLWPGEGWNFVFGQASLTDRVGVWSTARFGDPGASDAAYLLCLRRTLKVAVHETGHMLGIQHCTAYECGMNGSNNLPEADRNPLPFCPECAAKVWWACRMDPAAWHRSLVEFARREKLPAEAEFWQASLNSLEQTGTSP